MKSKIVIWGIFFLFFFFAAVYDMEVFGAEIEITGSVTNTIKSGVVDISLEQYAMNNHQLVMKNTNGTILPGETYSLIPIVYNKGADCYLRAKVVAIHKKANDENSSEFSLVEYITGVSDKWVWKDDCLYYKDIFHNGETLQIFDGISIPKSWNEEYSGAEFSVSLVAEAVQSADFIVDFKSDKPWGSFQTEKSKKDTYDFEALCVSGQQGITVIYENDAQQLLLTPDDFFAQFSAIYPGTSISDVVEVVNNSEDEKELFLKVTPVSKVDSFLGQLNLQITKTDAEGKTKVLYDGNYTADKIQNYISLGTVQKGETGKISFHIQMPSGLGNAYSLMNRDSIWTFMAKVKTEKSAAITEPSKTVVEKIVQAVGVKTMDASKSAVFLVLLFGACLIFLFCIRFRRKKYKDGAWKRRV